MTTTAGHDVATRPAAGRARWRSWPAAGMRLWSRLPRGFRWLLESTGNALIAIAVDRSVLAARREISFSTDIVIVDRPGGLLDLVFFYVGIAVLATIAARLALRFARVPRDPLAMPWTRRAAATTGWAVVMTVGLVAGSQVLVPRVDAQAEIAGRAFEPSWNLYLFVAPVASADCWLQTPIPLIVDQNRRWITRAYFHGRRDDVHTVMVVASRTPLHPAPLDRPGRYDCADIPRDVRRFARVVKRR